MFCRLSQCSANEKRTYEKTQFPDHDHSKSEAVNLQEDIAYNIKEKQ